MVGPAGFEPATSHPRTSALTTELRARHNHFTRLNMHILDKRLSVNYKLTLKCTALVQVWVGKSYGLSHFCIEKHVMLSCTTFPTSERMSEMKVVLAIFISE